MKGLSKRLGAAASHRWLLMASVVGSFFALAAEAGATATYDVTPITTGVTSELAANVPVILPLIGGLMALGIGIRLVKKFVKA